MKILVVGDGLLVSPRLGELLSQRGHAIDTIEATQVTLELRRRDYNIILLSLTQSAEQGIIICDRFKQLFPNSLMVALVSELAPDYLEQLLQAGADNYLFLSSPPETLQLRLSTLEHQARKYRKSLSSSRQGLNGFRAAALRQFPYIASHHLRQTLIQIKRQLNEFLIQPRQSPLDLDTTDYISEILNRARLMQQLIEDLLLDNSSTSPESTSKVPSTHQDFIILDENLIIQEHSEGIQRYADDAAPVQKGEDVRSSFPELTGVEPLLYGILRHERKEYELTGVARFSDFKSPIYFDLYVSKYPETSFSKTQLIVLLNDATERMIFQQKLLHSANEAQLLLRRLTATQHYTTQIINSMADALIVTTKNGIIKKINPATEYLFDYEEEKLIGQEISNLVLDQNFLEKTAQGISISQAEVPCQQQNGTEISVSFSCAIIHTEEDTQEFVYVGRDVTERKQAEAQIRQLNASLQQRTIELENVNEELESFSRTVSHDLRTPLSHIEFFTEMLQEEYQEYLDQEGQDYVIQISRSCRRMRQLIQDLLQLSRVTRTELTLEEINLSELAENVFENIRVNAPTRQVDLKISPNLYAKGNKALLQIVLENLLSNAWKYTSKQEVANIEVGLCMMQHSPDAEPTLTYFVRDNGAGFSMEYTDKLFRAFGRLHSQTEFEGTGIGLTTVQRIIQRHGGQIWAEGEIGKGATFYFTLGTNSEMALAENAS
ncbi:ATP-binding protein [Spirulina sp. CS-785/01]|uniref:ATP-binding protein n=1 Tax=Spirulina sp. CS-785/01 TaxID=3021716 RepID=UPI00232AA9C3|nr:ATP-binding protein [Spirulina sp. CS-785/01]MDB9315533.1 ATP-binding protein [Spirulina sp. CS-785/01]